METGFWGKLRRPIMVAAPMSGVTDEAFRLMFLKYGKPDVFWTEFVSAEGLFSRGRAFCLKILEFNKKERPIVAQLFGSDPVYFEKAAGLIAELGFNGIDINMGCPDRTIEKQGAGAILIKNLALAKEIIRATKKGASKLPVSVKTRIGYNKNEISEWISGLLEEDITALTVHFRTRDEMYFASAHWELAKEIVELKNKIAPKTLILGNGDIKSLKEALKLVKETGLDGIMVGRATLGNPWFFSEQVPTVSERLNAIIGHIKIFEKNGEVKHFDSMKKHFHAYTKGFRGAKELRENLMKVKNTLEARKTIENFLKIR
ncbi:MAG: tRNA-dihydrouridine synthase [Candidatus Staskawiczbacteria bacterium]|nr:tRNA-dihydrouridine synthase [Candidatus Staskawiczbacteria bacterium]